MRQLRALAHFVLAFAFLAAAIAQAHAAVCAPASAMLQEHHGYADGAGQVAQDHGSTASEHPIHKADDCQTACCFTAGQLPALTPETSTVEFFDAVRYVVAIGPMLGRAIAPDPGVPKLLA